MCGSDVLRIDQLLTEQERSVQEMVREFAQSELMPQITMANRTEEFNPQIMRDFGRLGLLGSTIPPEFEGAGLGYVGYGLIAHEIEAVDSSYRSALSVQSSLVCGPIFEWGSEEQKRAFLPGLVRGELIGCFGLTEPDSGSDPASMRTTARRVGNDIVLNGSKTWITNAPLADVLLVWAKSEEDNGAIRGYLIERSKVKSGSLTTPKIPGKLGLRASATGQIAMDEVVISADHAVLPNVKGMKGPFSCLNRARYGISWGSLGAAKFCFEFVREYLVSRVQFGRPLAHTQLHQLKLADMASEISLGLNASLRVGRMMEEGSMPLEAISLVKRNNCGKALAIARNSRDMLGGNGICDEYHVMRVANNLEAVNTYEGTHDVHGLILGRAIVGHPAF